MNRNRTHPILLVCLMAHVSAPAIAGTLRYENILAFELRDISLSTAPADADSRLRQQGFKTKEIPATTFRSGKHIYERTDAALHDLETFTLTYGNGIIQEIYYKHTYPAGYKKDSWKNYIHASEIDFALNVVCDSDATNADDCKSRSLYDSKGMTNFTISARRYGNYQQKYLLFFSAMYEGYIWQIKRAAPNE